jgi:hypothetical protein
VRSAHLVDRLEEPLAGGADVDLRVVGQREQEMLGRDVLVAEAARLLLRVLEDLGRDPVDRRRGHVLAGDLRGGVERLVRASADADHVHARVLEHGHDDAALLLEQGGEQVVRARLRVLARGGKALSGRERLL